MGPIQFLKHKIFGYGTFDSPYKAWYLRHLDRRAPKRNWRGIWRNGQPRPWIGRRDPRMASDAEFREIIKQNVSEFAAEAFGLAADMMRKP